MATQKITIGALIVILIASTMTVVYIQYQNVRIYMDQYETVFKQPNPLFPWIWSRVGTEKDRLFDGTSGMNVDRSKDEVVFAMNNKTKLITWTRTNYYQRGPVVVNTYTFSGDITKIEQFPVSHKVDIYNGSGYFYRYYVEDLKDTGPRRKLTNETTLSFGMNMKVELQPNYRWAWIGYPYGSDSLAAQYDIKSEHETFYFRVFDPTTIKLINSNITDTYVSGYPATPNVNYGWFGMIKVNISSIPDWQIITDAKYCAYHFDDATYYHDPDVSWGRVNFQNWQVTDSPGSLWDIIRNNITMNQTSSSKWGGNDALTWDCIDITSMIQTEYYAGNNYLGLAVWDPDITLPYFVSAASSPSSSEWRFGRWIVGSLSLYSRRLYSADYADANYRPYVNITYEAGDQPAYVILISPTNGETIYKSYTTLTCNATDDVYVHNVSLWMNSTGTWAINQTLTNPIESTVEAFIEENANVTDFAYYGHGSSRPPASLNIPNEYNFTFGSGNAYEYIMSSDTLNASYSQALGNYSIQRFRLFINDSINGNRNISNFTVSWIGVSNYAPLLNITDNTTYLYVWKGGWVLEGNRSQWGIITTGMINGNYVSENYIDILVSTKNKSGYTPTAIIATDFVSATVYYYNTSFNYYVSGLVNGSTYKWNCNAYDSASQSSWYYENWTFNMNIGADVPTISNFRVLNSTGAQIYYTPVNNISSFRIDIVDNVYMDIDTAKISIIPHNPLGTPEINSTMTVVTAITNGSTYERNTTLGILGNHTVVIWANNSQGGVSTAAYYFPAPPIINLISPNNGSAMINGTNIKFEVITGDVLPPSGGSWTSEQADLKYDSYCYYPYCEYALFNISDIAGNSSSNIEYAYISAYATTVGVNRIISIWEIENTSWTEASTCAVLNGYTVNLTSNQVLNNTCLAVGWCSINITQVVKTALNGGHTMLAVKLHGQNSSTCGANEGTAAYWRIGNDTLSTTISRAFNDRTHATNYPRMTIELVNLASSNLDKVWWANNSGPNTTMTAVLGYYYINTTNWTERDNHKVEAWANETTGIKDYRKWYYHIDKTTPGVAIQIPTNTTYTSGQQLNFTVADNHTSTCWYSINLGANNTLSICQNASNINGQGLGFNRLRLYVNDTVGHTNMTEVNYTIAEGTNEILLTINGEYNNVNISTSVIWSFASNADKFWYKLNGGSNVTIGTGGATSGTLNFSFITWNETNNIIVFGNRTGGNIYNSSIYNFSNIMVKLLDPTPQNNSLYPDDYAYVNVSTAFIVRSNQTEGYNFTITTFNDSTSVKNLTFSGSSSNYVYVSIPKNANVTNASITIKGYNVSTTWTQSYNLLGYSDANADYYWQVTDPDDAIPNAVCYNGICHSGSNEGTTPTPDVNNATTDAVSDTNISYSYFKINITGFPHYSDSISGGYFSVGVNDLGHNYTIVYNLSSFNAYTITYNTRPDVDTLQTSRTWDCPLIGYCSAQFNMTTAYIKQAYQSIDSWIYFRVSTYYYARYYFTARQVNGVYGFTIGYDSSPVNVTIDTGNDGTNDYNYSNRLNSTVTNINLNTTALQNYLANNCTTDICVVPIKISSTSTGIVELSSLNIKYNITTQSLEWNGVNESMNYGGTTSAGSNYSFYTNKTSLLGGSNYIFKVWAYNGSQWFVSETRNLTLGIFSLNYSHCSNVKHIEFRPTLLTSQNVSATNQSSICPALIITNNGTINTDVYINVNATLYHLDVYASNTSSRANAILLNTTPYRHYANLTNGSSYNVWLWESLNFPAGYGSFYFSINFNATKVT